jgi:uncharacterized membrane protein
MLSLVFLLIALIAAAWLYPQLPAQVPVHWNIHGQVDRYGPRFWVAALPALMILVVTALMVLLPAISPRKFEIAPFAQVYTIMMLATHVVVLVLGVSVLLAGAGYAVPIPTIAMLLLGALSMVIGNYTGKLRKNFFVGIRTPWTLSSDAVWERTHRLAGWLFMLGGLVAIVATLVGVPFWVAVAAVPAAGLIACVYSYFIYRAIEGRRH